MEIKISEKTYKRLKSAAVGGGCNWTPIRTDAGDFILDVDSEVYRLVHENPDEIINWMLDEQGFD